MICFVKIIDVGDGVGVDIGVVLAAGFMVGVGVGIFVLEGQGVGVLVGDSVIDGVISEHVTVPFCIGLIIPVSDSTLQYSVLPQVYLSHVCGLNCSTKPVAP